MSKRYVKQHNFQLTLRDGDFHREGRLLIGVPDKLTQAQRKQYEPYANIEIDGILVGTLTIVDLRRLRLWLNRVQIK